MYLPNLLGGLAGELRRVARAETPTHGQLRDRIVGLAMATIGIDLVCAALAYLFERHANATEVKSIGNALFWTTTQLLTVSSQIHNPFTIAGKILDVAMEAYAMTFVATLAGSVGSFMVKRGRELEQAAARHGDQARSD